MSSVWNELSTARVVEWKQGSWVSTVGTESRSSFPVSDPRIGGKVSLKGSLLHHLFYQYPPLGFPPQYESWKAVQYHTYDISLYDLISRLWTCLYPNLWCMCTYHCNYIYCIFISATSVYIDGYRWIALSVYSYKGHSVFIEICPWRVVYWNILKRVQAYYKNQSHMGYYSGAL